MKNQRGSKIAGGNPARGRVPQDYYATHSDSVKALLKVEEILYPALEPACVDEKTEYFNGNKWEKISKYTSGKILISNQVGKCKLEEPLKFIKTTTNKLYKFKSNYLDMALSSDHMVLYKSYGGKMLKNTIDHIVKKHKKLINGFRARIPISFNYCGSLKLDEYNLRIAIAVQADGRIRSKTNYVEFRIKKQRKKNRIEFLLNKSKINFRVIHKENGFSDYYFYSPLGCKKFPREWYNLTMKSKKIIVDEVFNWDGTISKKDGHRSYSTNEKENADFIQFCISSIGFGCNINKDKRNLNINYRVLLNNCGFSSLSGTSKTKRDFNELNGNFNVFCFKVSTGFFVCRRNDKIFITGNCGEGHISKLLDEDKVFSTDLIDRGYGFKGIDFLKENFSNLGKDFRTVITNPPFNLFQEFVEKALTIASDKVIMFGKLQALERVKRATYLQTTPLKTVYVFKKRQQPMRNGSEIDPLTGKKWASSTMAFAWYVWEIGYKGSPIIKWI